MGSKSREHVIPNWLQKHLGIEHESITLEVKDPFGIHQRSRRLNFGSMLLGRRVCGQCNHGWMSELEVAVAPTLISLVENGSISLLNSEQRHLVSRWAIKTLYALAFYADFQRLVPLSHTRTLSSEPYIAEGVHLFGSRVAADTPIDLIFCSTWNVFPEDSAFAETDFQAAMGQSYKIGIRVKSLALIAAFWYLPQYRLTICPGNHLPLWPPAANIVELPCEDFNPPASLYLRDLPRLVGSIGATDGSGPFVIKPRAPVPFVVADENHVPAEAEESE